MAKQECTTEEAGLELPLPLARASDKLPGSSPRSNSSSISAPSAPALGVVAHQQSKHGERLVGAHFA
jgi:hypothetical protein